MDIVELVRLEDDVELDVVAEEDVVADEVMLLVALVVVVVVYVVSSDLQAENYQPLHDHARIYRHLVGSPSNATKSIAPSIGGAH